MEIVRVKTAAQRAGAYYVRIHSMAVKHHITLEQEVDEHDETDAKHVIILDDVLPVATGRMYPDSDDVIQFGRLVVLPEYRGKGLGSMVLGEMERWAKELGYKKVFIASIDDKVGFYEKHDYVADMDRYINGEPFNCVYMEKEL